MRLGLIGTGKQGQRYLLEKNGGRHITVSGSRRIPLDDVDGVIIATHPAGHKELALEAIAAGKAVLVEKPLALNLADCEEILEAAESDGVKLVVAHTHLWAEGWIEREVAKVEDCLVTYGQHNRDYSPWLDWAPHGLALLADANPHEEDDWLRHSVLLMKEDGRGYIQAGSYSSHSGSPTTFPTPMWRMVKDFVFSDDFSIDFQRRVYRALFAE